MDLDATKSMKMPVSIIAANLNLRDNTAKSKKGTHSKKNTEPFDLNKLVEENNGYFDDLKDLGLNVINKKNMPLPEKIIKFTRLILKTSLYLSFPVATFSVMAIRKGVNTMDSLDMDKVEDFFRTRKQRYIDIELERRRKINEYIQNGYVPDKYKIVGIEDRDNLENERIESAYRHKTYGEELEL